MSSRPEGSRSTAVTGGAPALSPGTQQFARGLTWRMGNRKEEIGAEKGTARELRANGACVKRVPWADSDALESGFSSLSVSVQS